MPYTLIATIAGFCVALAEAVTREPIAEAKRKAFVDALGEVLPKGVPEPVATPVAQADGTTNIVYLAGDAVAMEVSSSKGYAGDIVLLVGFRGDGTLHGYKVLDHKETPGLGANIAGSFRAAVTNRPAATTVWKVKKDGGDIDAITVNGENSDRWMIYEGILDANKLPQNGLSAVEYIFFEERRAFMKPGQKYEGADGEPATTP